MSEYTNLYLEGGYQELKFDKGGDFNNAAIDQLGLSATDAAAVRDILRDNEDTSSFYIKFEIDNKPSISSTTVSPSRRPLKIGFSSNSYDLYHVDTTPTGRSSRTPNRPGALLRVLHGVRRTRRKGQRVGAGLGIRYHFSIPSLLGSIIALLAKTQIWKTPTTARTSVPQSLLQILNSTDLAYA